MLSGLSAKNNSVEQARANDIQNANARNTSTWISNPNAGDKGYHAMVAYHGDSFYGLRDGTFETAILTVTDWAR